VHSLATAFVLGYHGGEAETAERLLRNESFQPSANDYDWLGPGIYFWEANPDRALDWARDLCQRKTRSDGQPRQPAVVGAAIDLGFTLDLLSSNGIQAVEQSYGDYQEFVAASGANMPENVGGAAMLARHLDCAVIKFIHALRKEQNEAAFDTVRGIFAEGEHIYPNSGFRKKTHVQICVCNPDCIKGVFRVPAGHFSAVAAR
jgi:hypothetical protein